MKLRETMLPVLRPYGGEEEVNALKEVIESGWWGKGPKVAEFEKKFAELVGANSHGFARLSSYCYRIKKKVINPNPKIKIKNISQLYNMQVAH